MPTIIQKEQKFAKMIKFEYLSRNSTNNYLKVASPSCKRALFTMIVIEVCMRTLILLVSVYH